MKRITATATIAALSFGAFMAASPAAEAATTSTRTVTGYVWNDADGDHRMDANEGRVKKREVVLINSRGKIVKRTVTNSQGRFTFTKTPRGIYTVRTLASGYTHTTVAGANLKTTAASKGYFRATVTVKTSNPTVNFGVIKKVAPNGGAGNVVTKVPTGGGINAKTTQDVINEIFAAHQAKRKALGLNPLVLDEDLLPGALTIAGAVDMEGAFNTWTDGNIGHGYFTYGYIPSFAYTSTSFDDSVLETELATKAKYNRVAYGYDAKTKTLVAFFAGK